MRTNVRVMQPGQSNTKTGPACDPKNPCKGRPAHALSPMGDSKAKLSCLGTPLGFGTQRPVSHMLPEAMVLFDNKFRTVYDRKVKHTLIKEHSQNILLAPTTYGWGTLQHASVDIHSLYLHSLQYSSTVLRVADSLA